MADVGTPTVVNDLVEAVGDLAQAFKATGTFGLIHARTGLLIVAGHLRMIVRDSAAPGIRRTPGGRRWVFGGGYSTPLGDTIFGTSAASGWRD